VQALGGVLTGYGEYTQLHSNARKIFKKFFGGEDLIVVIASWMLKMLVFF